MSKMPEMRFPDDLNQDWLNAVTTNAPEEYDVEIRDEWRQSVEPIPELFVPPDLLDSVSDWAEPELTDIQELLYTVAEQHPGELDVKDDFVIDTAYALSMLKYDPRDKIALRLAHWARRIGFALMRMGFDKSRKVQMNFYASIQDAQQWSDSAAYMIHRGEQDESWRGKLDSAARFMAELKRDQKMIRQMIALTIAQIEHWREVQAAMRTRKMISRLEREPYHGMIETDVVWVAGDAANRHDADDMTYLPLDEIVDETTGEMIASDVQEPVMSERAAVVYDMMRLWSVLPIVIEIDSVDTQETRTMMNRAGYPGGNQVAEARWMRQIVLRQAGVSFTEAGEISARYTRDHKMSGERWKRHTEKLYRKFKKNAPELLQLINDCMELAQISESTKEMCRRMAALSHAELVHWQQLTEFVDEIKATISVDDWAGRLAFDLQMAEIDELPSSRRERGYKINRYIGLMARGLAATGFQEKDLVPLPLDTIIEDDMRTVKPSNLDETISSVRHGLIQVASTARKIAIERYKQEGPIHAPSRELAELLSQESDEHSDWLAYQARFCGFVTMTLNYEKFSDTIHQYITENPPYSAEDAPRVADQAVERAYEFSGMAEILDMLLVFVAHNEEDMAFARKIACLTIDQIARWKRDQDQLEQSAHKPSSELE